jgi:hypothetical protein
MQRADRRGVIERLADIPWAAHFPHLHLQIAARHVESECVAKHVIECVIDGDIFTPLADCRDQFHFVVAVVRLGRIRKLARCARCDMDDGVGWLAEEKWRLAIRIEAHLARMGGVVAPDAVDAPDGKCLVRTGNRDRHRGCGLKDQIH